jgi:hypothetical protein
MQCSSSGPALEEDLNCLTREMKTLRSFETSHPRTFETSATSLYRKLNSRTLSIYDATRVASVDLGSKGVSVKTVYKMCMLVKSFRTWNAMTRNFVPFVL